MGAGYKDLTNIGVIQSPNVNARCFSTTSTISSSLGSMTFLNKSYDASSSYSLGTGIYTIPVAGTYLIGASIIVGGTIALNNTLDMQLIQSGSLSQTSESKMFSGGAVTDFNGSIEDCFNCAIGDTIVLKVSCSATNPVIAASSSQNFIFFSKIG